MPKEYGKLTPDQFGELLQFLLELLSMLRSMNVQLANTHAAKFDSVMPGDYGLDSHVYELPFIDHLSLVTVALNRHGEVHDMAVSLDPKKRS